VETGVGGGVGVGVGVGFGVGVAMDWQVEEQFSACRFPGSQSSPSWTMPSPHTGWRIQNILVERWHPGIKEDKHSLLETAPTGPVNPLQLNPA
jgi:hypothetical protein